MSHEAYVRKLDVRGFYPSTNVTDVFLIEKFLNKAKCERWLERFQEEDKTLRVDDRFRKNDRITIYDEKAARHILGEIYHDLNGGCVGSLFHEREFYVDGCNDRFHLYRYSKPGDQFTLHADQPYIDEERARISFYTVLIYLNDDYEGGEALVGGEHKFKPPAGSALIFPHYILHGAAPLISGERYTLRTDIMYKSSHIYQHGVKNLGRAEVLP